MTELAFTQQIKLAEISAFNWGSFDGLHTARVDPDGTLITGDNGSGKTTLVDGVMALLLPAGKNAFNIAAAQGDRSDRSLLSYIRGSYGKDHDGARTRVRNKRDGPTHTALRALYKADDGSEVVIAALFWTTQTTSKLSEVQRIYLIGRTDYTLRQLLLDFGDGNVRQLKQKLNDNPRLQLFDGSFDEYRECYQRALRIENRNAPELLARALGLKKIDDLTLLIRTLVLEPSGVREDARNAVNEFNDLRAIHEKMVDAGEQVEALDSLPRTTKQISALQQQIDMLIEEIRIIGSFFAQQSVVLWDARRKSSEVKVSHQQKAIEDLKLQLEASEAEERDRYADYREAGGDRIENLRRDLSNQELALKRVISNASEYQKAAGVLGLSDSLQQNLFQQNQDAATGYLDDSETPRKEAQDEFAAAGVVYSQLQGRLQALKTEIQEVESRPDSNIGTLYQRMREELVSALNIDKQSLPFIGELIDVADDQRDWQGAIERALGGLRTTLAVPESELARVTGWVNRRNMGVHVRLQVVREVSGSAHFKQHGYLRKLQWQQHPYREWLKHHLARFDLDCVDNPDALNNTPHAMTKEGLIQHEKGRYEKKDQQLITDRKYWSLGFSNRTRLGLLTRELKNLDIELEESNANVSKTREALDQFEQQHRHWQTLRQFRWSEVDLPTVQSTFDRIQRELTDLQKSTGKLATAKEIWQQAGQRLQAIKLKLDDANKTLWSLNNELKKAADAIVLAEHRIDGDVDPEVTDRLHKRVGDIEDNDLERIGDTERHYTAELNAKKNHLDDDRSKEVTRALQIISRFKTRWKEVSIDWSDKEVSHCDDYLEHLVNLQKEGLPQLVEKFSKRLNLHTTQSLANIREKIESEREEIRDRIDVINKVLFRTEFKSGSHLRLKIRREQHANVTDLDQRLKSLLNMANKSDNEARFQQLWNVIEAIEKASNPTTAHTQESKRLLDPRYQMNFCAEEVDSETGVILDVLESSDAKSGGEKESFAGIIVAASLAYVLTPAGNDSPVYSTVFLDEAFANTHEATSRRVLRVFKELGIHINLITPYKNLNLAREAASSLLIAERNAETHESRLCEVTWEEIDQQQKEKASQTLAEAADLNIVVEHSDPPLEPTPSH